MGKKAEILYNDDNMQNIIDDYHECITIIQEVRTYNTYAKVAFNNNYEGEAKDMTEAIFDEIKLHLDYLETCCRSMEDYVSNAWDAMKVANEALAR